MSKEYLGRPVLNRRAICRTSFAVAGVRSQLLNVGVALNSLLAGAPAFGWGCPAILEKFLGIRGPTINEVVWVGERVSQVQFETILLQMPGFLKKGARVKVISYEERLRSEGTSVDARGIAITEKGQFLEENRVIGVDALLQASEIETNPHEVARLRFYDTNQREYVGRIIQGGASRVSGSEIFGEFQLCLASYNNLPQRGVYGALQRIVFEHTHPFYELQSEVGGKVRTSTLPVTDADIAAAQRIILTVPGLPFLLRAVIPNGYTYSVGLRG